MSIDDHLHQTQTLTDPTPGSDPAPAPRLLPARPCFLPHRARPPSRLFRSLHQSPSGSPSDTEPKPSSSRRPPHPAIPTPKRPPPRTLAIRGPSSTETRRDRSSAMHARRFACPRARRPLRTRRGRRGVGFFSDWDDGHGCACARSVRVVSTVCYATLAGRGVAAWKGPTGGPADTFDVWALSCCCGLRR